MTQEIELKLGVPPKLAGQFRRLRVIRDLAVARPRSRRMLSVYYDTPALDFRSRKAEIRVRKVGAGHVMTLKRDEDPTLGPHARREWETKIAGGAPRLEAVDDAEFGALVTEVGPGAKLEPVFESDIDRRSWTLRSGDSEIALTLDVGEIRASGRRSPVSEAELELKAGEPSSLFEVARLLRAELELPLETQTKSERGYDLAAGASPKAYRAEPIALDPAMTGIDAFRLLARACLLQIRRNVACAAEGSDVEGVHQMRVGVRRLRALLSLFRKNLAPEPLARVVDDLKWLQGALGPAREWDVFIGETVEPLIERRGGEPGLIEFLGAARDARTRAYKAFRAALAQPRFADVVLSTEQRIEDGSLFPAPGEDMVLAGPVLALARDALRRRDRKMRRHTAALPDMPEEELHELRLEAKKARYAAEFFRSLFPAKSAKRYIAAVTALQDRLGALNDAYVSRGLIDALRKRRANRAAARAEGLITGWFDARIEDDRRHMQDDWERYLDVPRFWKRG